jgi:Ser/Thr protein kinase RdoA (MazF antagonist)
MQQATIRRAYTCYGLPDSTLLAEQKGYRNTSYPAKLSTGERVNLILYKQEPGMRERIVRIHHVSASLAAHNLPVRTVYDPRILKLHANNTERYAALHTYLPGYTIPWEAYTKHHLKLVGMAMGQIHTALKDVRTKSPSVADEYLEILERMQAYFSAQGVVHALENKLQLHISQDILSLYKTIVGRTKFLPGQHMLHMDLVRGNILFDKTNKHTAAPLQVNEYMISGILDLEKTAYGHPVFDIARTLAFLLVDSKYKPPEKVRKYFLQSGYAKRGGCKIPRIIFTKDNETYDMLEQLTNLFLLYDFYKFLRHNPYESLYENEHFIRTRAMLIDQKVIQSL